MSILGRMFADSHRVVDGTVACPLDGCTSVEACARCPWQTSFDVRGVDRDMIVFCRPRASSLADLPPN